MVDLEVNSNKYCYTCLKLDIGRTSYMRLDFSIPGDIPYTKKLKFCIPEMLLEDIDACILCKQCSIALDSAYLFRVMCLETETKLQSLRQQKDISIVNSLQEEPSILGFNVVDVRSLCGTEQCSDPSIAIFEASGTTDTDVSRKTPLTDEEIIAKCCATIPELKDLTPKSLQCWVASKKIVPMRMSGNKRSSHYLSVRKQEKLWCPICDKYILGKNHYQYHLKRHLNVAFICTTCSVDFKTQTNLSLHRSLCPKRSEIEEKIITKPPKLTNKPNKHATIKKKTEIIKVKFNCKIRKAIQTGIFNCKMCTFKTNGRSVLKSHYKSHIGTPPYSCNYCSKIFQDCNKFIRHMHEAKHPKWAKATASLEQSVANPVDNISPPSSSCPKIFQNINKFLYRVQEAKHNKPMKTKANIRRYTKNPKRNIGSPPFQCTTCLKIFQNSTKFRRHMRLAKHTQSGKKKKIGKLEGNIGAPPFICPLCSKVFDVSSKFLRHVREAKHTRKTRVKKMRVQVEVKPERHFCDVCDMAFLSEVELSDHRENLHNNAKNLNLDEETFHQIEENCNLYEEPLHQNTENLYEEPVHQNTENLDEEPLEQNSENCNLEEEPSHQSAENGNISEEMEDIVSEMLEPSNEYYCNYCMTKFKKLEFFFNHNCTTDLLEPVYNCHLCKMSLSGRISLIEHMEVHFHPSG